MIVQPFKHSVTTESENPGRIKDAIITKKRALANVLDSPFISKCLREKLVSLVLGGVGKASRSVEHRGKREGHSEFAQ